MDCASKLKLFVIEAWIFLKIDLVNLLEYVADLVVHRQILMKTICFNTKASTFRFLLRSFLMLTITIPSLADEAPANKIAPSIEQLSHKLFRINSISGSRSMTLINNLPDDAARHNLSTKGYGEDCTDNYAHLNHTTSAAIIPKTHTLVAILDCPAANDGGAESIIAVFDSNNTDIPVCFSHLDLMSKAEYFYWGSVRSIEVKRHPDGGYIVIPALSGGDAGDSWESFVFLHVDNQCHATVLSSFYAGMYYEVDKENECEGEKLTYKFVNDTTIHVKQSTVSCSATGEKIKTANIKKLDTRALLSNPKLRIFEP